MSATIDREIVEAMLQRGRVRMVDTYISEGALVNPQQMYDYWRGFASCAKTLLSELAEVMALHDKAGDPQRAIQAAFARLPNDFECFTLADMKRHMWAGGVDFGSELITDRNVDAIEQLQNAVGAAVKFDDEHAVAGVDVQDGGVLHCDSRGIETFIVREVTA